MMVDKSREGEGLSRFGNQLFSTLDLSPTCRFWLPISGVIEIGR